MALRAQLSRRSDQTAVDEVFDVTNGRSHDITHLRPAVISYCLLLDKRQVSVNLHVYYANHCYTRSRMANDPVDAVLFREWKSVRHQQLRLNIRSVHYRTNQPAGVRGMCRFFQILGPFYLAQRTKYHWI
jgi:hypothetical protein